jgi:hypothetical protein
MQGHHLPEKVCCDNTIISVDFQIISAFLLKQLCNQILEMELHKRFINIFLFYHTKFPEKCCTSYTERLKNCLQPIMLNRGGRSTQRTKPPVLINPFSATGRYIGFSSSGEKCREPIYQLKGIFCKVLLKFFVL